MNENLNLYSRTTCLYHVKPIPTCPDPNFLLWKVKQVKLPYGVLGCRFNLKICTLEPCEIWAHSRFSVTEVPGYRSLRGRLRAALGKMFASPSWALCLVALWCRSGPRVAVGRSEERKYYRLASQDNGAKDIIKWVDISRLASLPPSSLGGCPCVWVSVCGLPVILVHVLSHKPGQPLFSSWRETKEQNITRLNNCAFSKSLPFR